MAGFDSPLTGWISVPAETLLPGRSPIHASVLDPFPGMVFSRERPPQGPEMLVGVVRVQKLGGTHTAIPGHIPDPSGSITQHRNVLGLPQGSGTRPSGSSGGGNLRAPAR
jgi:hypothetical protein